MANNWNVCQYSVLLMMFACACGLVPGELLHVIADAHIYDRHVPIVRDIIARPQFDAPKVTLRPENDFYAFTASHVKASNYKYNDFDGEIPIAI